MINFFKKLLKPKEETIQFSEIKKRLDENNDELQRIKDSFKEVESLKSEISEKLKILKDVDVSQAKVEEKVKSIVKGNLPAYTNAIGLFLKRVVPPEDINHISLEIFYDSFENEFKDLNKRTFRNFQIIRELVGKELEDVAKGIKKLELLVKEIKKDSKKIKETAEIKGKVDFIEDSIKNKEKNKSMKESLEKEKEKLSDSCEKIKKEIEKAKNSKKAKELEELKSKEKSALNNLKELDNQLLTLFSPLHKALKKYNNMCFIKKVDSYIENPIKTLFKDSDLEILKFLTDIRKMVEEGKIDLKDDKKKKTLESLEELNESFLKKFLEDNSSLKEKLSSIKDRIKENTVMKDIENLEKEFNVSSFKIENIGREIEKIKDIDVESEIEKLEKRLKEVFGYKVNIENAMG